MPMETEVGFLKSAFIRIVADYSSRSARNAMADLILTRTTQQTKASGVAGLFGLFAGLCAIFAGCVTLSDWHEENTQARWPLVSAMVERMDVVAVTRGRKDSGR